MMTTDAGPRPSTLAERPPAGRVRRWRRWHPVAAGGALAGLALALAVAWYLGSPLLIRSRVEEAAAGPPAAVIAQGAFADRDAVHRGAGRAALVRDAEGRAHLRLDDLRVTNGPDLYVFLTPAAAPATHEDVTRDALNLGRLKAPEGTFGYALPAGADPARYGAAVIYCYRFRTVFSVAPLTPG